MSLIRTWIGHTRDNEAMGRFGTTEIIIVLAIVVLLFGGAKIPQLMRGIGEGMREFKKGLADGHKPPES